jgi:Na+/melibiose symporter-like transporter
VTSGAPAAASGAPAAAPGPGATVPPLPVVRLPLGVKLGYGGGEWANSVVWTLFYALFLYFLTDVVGVGAATAGLIMMVGTLWNAAFQPLVGVWSDRLRSAKGRRRPFLIAAALPYGVATWLLFTDWGLGTAGTVAYMVAAVLFYFTCLALFYVPYGALAAELTSSYDERTSLNTFRTLFAQVGALVGAAAPLALNDVLGDLLGSERAGWSAAAALMGVLSTAGILWTWRATGGREQHTQAAAVRLRDVFGTLRNRSFRFLLLAYVLGWAPLNVIGAVSVYFAVYRMGYSEDYASLVMLTWFLVGVAWLPLVAWMSRRYGKRATYIVFTLTWAAIQCLFLLPGPEDVVLFWVAIVLSSAGSMAVAVWLAGLVLELVGYQADVEQTATAMWGIRLLMSLGAAVWLVPGAVFCWLMPLTRRRHQAVLAAIEARAAGEPWENDEVRAVL